MVFFGFSWFYLIFFEFPGLVPKFRGHGVIVNGRGVIVNGRVVFLYFEIWVADLQGFDVRFGFSMSKSPRGQVLSRFRWSGAGRNVQKQCFLISSRG